MNTLKKNWGFVLIAIVSIGLGAIALFTAMKLSTKEPVAPTVPQKKPQAASTACTVSFSITPVITPTPSASASATPTASPTPTPVAECGSTCTSSSQCPGTMICSGGLCRNPSCTTDTDCICATPTPTPSPTPSPTPIAECNSSCTSSSQCPGSMICSNSVCRNPSCTSESSCSCPTPTPTPTVITNAPYCGSTCTSNSDCPSTMICLISSGASTGICRNPSCVSESSCSCTITYANPTARPSYAPVPEVPVSGSILPTAAFAGFGIFLIAIGFAL